MPRSLPFPASRACLTLVATALLVLAGVAQAFEFASVTPSRDVSNQLWASLRMEDPIETRVERSLKRGMPATFVLHAELWRKRSGWFDRMERSVDATVRIRYDSWNETWILERSGADPFRTHSADSLEAHLSQAIVLPVARLDRAALERRFYLVLSATMQPLSVKDVDEVERWLTGEVRAERRSSIGVITQLPSSVFEAVRNFAGFGDSRARAITPDFTPSQLPLAPHLEN